MHYKRRCLCGYTFATAFKTEALGSGGFDGYPVKIKTEIGGHVGTHGVDILAEFRPLGYDGDVDVGYMKMFRSKQLHYPPQQYARVGTLVSVIGVGKMLSYIAHSSCSEQRVAKGVERHIGIAMSEQALCMRHFYATEYEVAPVNEAVHIISRAYTEIIHAVKAI